MAVAPPVLDHEDEIRRQTREVQELVEGIADDRFRARPAPDRWSLAEHIQHLAITNGEYVDAIQAGIRRARERGMLGPGPVRRRRFAEWFVRTMEPPVTRRLPTLRRLKPPPGLERDRVLADFAAAQERVLAALRSAEGVHLGRATMRSPFFKPLRLSLDQAFRAVLAHNRRHIWHVRRALERTAAAS